MKLLMLAYIVRMAMILIDRKAAKNKATNIDADESQITHPAGFRVR